MFPETAARAEMQYRQQRFLDEAQARRLARSVAPARTARLAGVLGRLVRWGSARRLQAAPPSREAAWRRSQAGPEGEEVGAAAADRGGPGTADRAA